jgi:hypothetical protein
MENKTGRFFKFFIKGRFPKQTGLKIFEACGQKDAGQQTTMFVTGNYAINIVLKSSGICLRQ